MLGCCAEKINNPRETRLQCGLNTSVSHLKYGFKLLNYVVFVVPRRGLEPPRFYPLVPETSASTNSATWATQEMNYGERQKMCQQHFTLFSGAARPGDAAGCASPVTVVSTRQSMRTGVVAPTHRRAVRRRCACCADAGARWSAARCRRRCRGRP